jgi:putative ABC transport system permease protein
MIRLALQGLRYYWKLSLCHFCGVFLASAILTGSLLVGDSVKETLRQAAGQRIGGVEEVLVTGERFVTQALAERISKRAPQATIAPVLFAPATISTPDKKKRANSIWIYGVDNSFWKLAGVAPPEGDYLAIGEPLARQLSLSLGNSVITRMEFPGRISRDAPLSGESELMAAVNGAVTHIIPAGKLGAFSLLADQTAALNVFVPINLLQEKLGKIKRINLILSGALNGLESIVQECWSLADTELELRPLMHAETALVSNRVFISRAEERAIFSAWPESEGVLSYLINDFHHGGGTTPYSVAAGIGVRAAKRLGVRFPSANEIVINDWLAGSPEQGGLGIGLADEIGISFFAVKNAREFIVVGDGKNPVGAIDPDDIRTFRVSGLVAQDSGELSEGWIPDFPGLETAQTLSSWESGLPIDTQKIRPSDEEFWQRYRATPKAFIALPRAQQLWGNRFGQLSGIHLGHEVTDEDEFTGKLRHELLFTDLGMSFRGLSEDSRHAVEGSLNFGILFTSLSGFLIGSALLLVALLCVFGMESRASQIGLLLAIGYSRRQVHRIFLCEAGLVCLAGACLGACGGIVYTKFCLWGLGDIWSGASAGIPFIFHARAASVFSGALVIFIAAVLTIWFAGRKITALPPRALLGGDLSTGIMSASKASRRKIGIYSVGLGLAAGGLLVCIGTGLKGENLAGAFFGAGVILLAVGLEAFMLVIDRNNNSNTGNEGNLSALGRRNVLRKKGRSMMVVAMVAAGVFLITAVNAFRLQSDPSSDQRDTGTGGFDYIGTTTLPVYEDLNTDVARDRFGLEQYSLNEVNFVQLRVGRDGEEASCLNLNHSVRPRLVGVNPAELANRQAFRFASVQQGMEFKKSPWELLEPGTVGNEIPVIGDKASVMWALKKNLGESITYTDGNGGELQLRIVALLENSVLQGNLLISDDAFIKFFPNSGGHRLFLVDVDSTAAAGEIADNVTKALDRQGMALERTDVRLADYARVQNTYISIFSVLGGLGVLLGTAGVGLVIARNVVERRREFAVMTALGFQRKALVKMVLSEHFTLVLAGLFIGVTAALITVAPNLLGHAAGFPLGIIIFLTAMIALGGLCFCLVATQLALRGSFLEVIASE